MTVKNPCKYSDTEAGGMDEDVLPKFAWEPVNHFREKRDSRLEISFLPFELRRCRRYMILLLFLLGIFTIFYYSQTPLSIRRGPAWNLNTPCNRDFSRNGHRNSVPCFFEKAKIRGLALQRTQSKSIEAARSEYLRRYGRQPPNGFDQWFHYSKQIGSPIIDDYDQIEANLQPFRSLSAKQMQEALNRVTNRTDPLDTFSIRSGRVYFPGDPKRKHIRSMHAVLDPIAPKLPDMDFVLNWGDREAVKGWEEAPGEGPKDPKKTSRNWHTDGWTFYTAACPSLYLSQNSLIDRPEINLCENLHNNALVEGRADMQQGVAGISSLVPIMSWAKFSTSRDLLVPHWALADPVFRGWDLPPDEITFQDKTPDLYWRGSTTGSSVAIEKWRHNYRVRFVQYIQDLKAMLQSIRQEDGVSDRLKIMSAIRLEDNEANRRMLMYGLRSENFNVEFTGLAQCGTDRRGCSSLANSTGIVKGDHKIEESHHRFLFDIDGNSMSGRFYRLLQTNGLVFKQTLLGEWHDDRLIPWFHYVPLGFSSLGDLPHLLDYFLNDRKGREIAEIIALQGRKAVETSFRLEDLTQYWYRLLLEYHSLFQEE